MSRKRVRNVTAVMGDLAMAPMVAAMRLPMMAAESQRAGSVPTETMRATTEKAMAFAEGMAAAQINLVSAMWSFWPDVMRGRDPVALTSSTIERTFAAAFAPAGLSVRSNMRRLAARRSPK